MPEPPEHSHEKRAYERTTRRLQSRRGEATLARFFANTSNHQTYSIGECVLEQEIGWRWSQGTQSAGQRQTAQHHENGNAQERKEIPLHAGSPLDIAPEQRAHPSVPVDHCGHEDDYPDRKTKSPVEPIDEPRAGVGQHKVTDQWVPAREADGAAPVVVSISQ